MMEEIIHNECGERIEDCKCENPEVSIIESGNDLKNIGVHVEKIKKIGTWLPDADKCQKCELLIELYESTEKTPRDYWVMSEIFVMLHGGDVCHK